MCRRFYFRSVIISIAFLTGFCFSQPQEWKNLYHYDQASMTVAFEGNYVWSGGEYLVKLNTITGEITKYSSQNAGLQDRWLIKSIVVDAHGNKWIGTASNGLIKFNDTVWTIYNKSNSGFPSNYINCQLIDRSGTHWIGTLDSGLVKYDGNNWTVYNYRTTGLPIQMVRSIDCDRNGILWIGALRGLSGGLLKFDGTNWTSYTTSNSGLPHMAVVSIAIAADGKKWIATQKGLAVFNDTSWQVYKSDNSGLPDNYVTALKFDSDGNLWGYALSLFKFNGLNWNVFNPSVIGFPAWNIQSLNFGNDHGLWCASVNGLVCYKDSEWKNYITPDCGLSGNKIFSVKNGRHGDVWIATYDSGLVHYEAGLRHFVSYPLSANFTCFDLDNNDNIWAAFVNLGKYSGQEWSNFSWVIPQNSRVNYLRTDRLNNVWIGTTIGGLVKFNGIDKVIYDTTNSILRANTIYDILIDRGDTVWITNYNGVYRKSGENWKFFTYTDWGTQDSALWCATFDDNGNIWFASQHHIIKYNGAAWEKIELPSLKPDLVSPAALAIEGDRTIWLGTHSGLYKYNGTTWTLFDSTNSGLKDSNITSICIDSRGNKWIGTAVGGVSIYREGGVILSKDEPANNTVTEFQLKQNYPNPFNPTTNISYIIPRGGDVRLAVFDILGRQAAVLVNEYQQAGSHTVTFNASALPSGVYFYRLTAGSYSVVKKLMVIK